MHCPYCLSEDIKTGVRFTTNKRPVDKVLDSGGIVHTHPVERKKVKVGLNYNNKLDGSDDPSSENTIFSQLYADVCNKCGTIIRSYIKTKGGK